MPNEFLVDKSSLLQGVTRYIEKNLINGTFLIHRALLRQLEQESKQGLVTSDIALEEIEKLKELSERYLFAVELVGKENGDTEQELRNYCLERGCNLLTADELTKKMADLLGIGVTFLDPLPEPLTIETFFDESTMSVHLKEDAVPKAKKGKPGDWEFRIIRDTPVTGGEIKKIVSEILNSIRWTKGSFIEIERKGSTIVQLSTYRIVITRPPLSDGWELTATRPVARKKLEDYALNPELVKRLEERAEGILIAGSPGMGKTTFAQALAEYYMKMGKIVKTIESPRDMHLPSDITQYSKNYAEIGELHDILLLSRPDYTVYDEMRNDEDFRLYIDLRLAGIGMIGVVHATTAIDAIHRFLNRVDLGTVPGILDTVLFINKGTVEKVYSLEMTVKVPEGLREADLARPVVQIKDFLNDRVEYEIYVFGEQTMIVPVGRLNLNTLENRITRAISGVIPDAKVKKENGEYVVEIPREGISSFNRKINTKLRKLEKKHGIRIRVKLQDKES
ncbi:MULTISPECIES: PINc/VapC family ATPase [Metallosphaera]|uniref:ATPase, PilT family n=2 Tax=Metallosphaera sedula TaxID=43687 RepID=A4YI13_METS5|nr:MULTISPECIES: PINc/VapC family ATPase [Metallosphaera]ABP96065.1 ATPase, PilT family [Metallosphaera sedula DSM 5348]AIM28049.1 ATPase, PilT family [Metallosphaera sedula]AKV74882.1 ATPase [Metallosphaera sedula]AKV77119.1 ATPase [Metallosphaera sedula]AKV79370.1 ATPase [Metallosphaera sedula]